MAARITCGGAVVLVLVVAAAVMVEKSTGATYTVADSMGWTIPSGGAATYSSWASQHTFLVGDVLVFNYTTGAHDVAKVDKASFDSCASTNPISLDTVGPTRVTLSSAGDNYWICTFGQHCSFGQKLSLKVSAASTSTPPPAPTPKPTPSTPPPSPPPAAKATPPQSPSHMAPPTMPPTTVPMAPTPMTMQASTPSPSPLPSSGGSPSPSPMGPEIPSSPSLSPEGLGPAGMSPGPVPELLSPPPPNAATTTTAAASTLLGLIGTAAIAVVMC